MAKEGRGRPHLPADQVRRFLVGFRATAEEKRQIQRWADAAHLDVSDWIRGRVFGPDDKGRAAP